MPRKSVFEEIAREWDDAAELECEDDDLREPISEETRELAPARASSSTDVDHCDPDIVEKSLPFDYSLLSPMGRMEVIWSEERIIEIEKRSILP